MEINRQIFAASLIQVPETEEALQREEDTLKAIPQRIVDEGFDAVNELLSIDRLGIAVYNETTHQLEYASNSIENELSSAGDNGTSTAEDELWKEVVQRCFEQHTQLSAPGFEALPLVVDAAGDSRCVGVLYLERQENVDQETAHLLLELIARYIAIVVFNAVVKLATKYRDIADNKKRLKQHIEQCAAKGAQLVVLQELHNSLYFCQTESTDNFDLAESIPGESTEFYSRIAGELHIVLVTSLFERRAAGLYHNTAVVFDTDGSIAGKYRKMHIPDDPAYYEKF